MKKQILLCTLYAIMVYLTGFTFNPTFAASQPSGGNGTHFCGVIDSSPDKQHSNQFPNRRYARTSANLDVGEPYTVRLIYFLPNDRQPRPGIDIELHGRIKGIQQYFADVMEYHGFGRKTFRFETDADGKAVAHHVRGRFSDAYYQNPSVGSWIVWNEIEEQFDMSRNIYLLVLDISSEYLDGTGDYTGGLAGLGSGDSLSGRVLVTASDTDIALHELGHAFGLMHDTRSDAKLYSGGYGAPMVASFCSAEWLDVHRYFNTSQNAFNGDTSVQMLTPSLAAPPYSIRLRFEVADPDGLHQAQLFKPFGGYSSVIACKQLNGKRTAVEFVTTELVGGNDIVLRVIDAHGNFTWHSFPIDITPLLPPPEVISIPDPNLATVIRETLGMAPGDIITQLAMLSLDNFDAGGRQITNLTGIERATNINWLILVDNQIHDITPLAGLTKLRGLFLDSNNISDLSPLVTNTGLGSEDTVFLRGNPLSYQSIHTHIPALQSRGVTVGFDNRTVTTLLNISGVITASNHILTVEVRDSNGRIFEGVPVTFAVISGGGTLSVTNTTTDKKGRAQSTLTLGKESNRVTVSAVGAEQTVTFSDEAGVHISDPNLRAVIATALGKQPSDRIRRGDMANLTRLDARNANISDLTGLEGATNLRILDLGAEYVGAENRLINSNSVSDISAVAGLTNLTSLNLGNNSVSDISTVAGLTNLTSLYLEGNSVSDISAVAGLTNLTSLDLGGNPVSDISAVAGLTNLTSLYLWGNHNSISDISAVAGLTNLTSLYLGGNSVSDISAVAGLTNLTSLDLWENNISDISPLAENTGLAGGDEVYVQGNPLSYLSIHTHIPTLQSRGVTVEFDNQAHSALLKISGDNQKGVTGAALEDPFVVEVQDANGSALVGVPVTFVVTTGGGTPSTTRTTTDAYGMAQSILTLGPNLGTSTVEVSAAGIQGTAIFHAISESPPIIADVNGDGSVNILDLVSIASEFESEKPNLAADVNKDGVINILDLILVAGMFEGAAAAPAAHPQAPEALTAAEVQGWLTDARALEVRDPIMKQGFMVLEQLLVSLTPRETELLPNYPNPFNPETWIPYRLAEDAFVTLTIYDQVGHVVRTLEVGHQIAAVYENRSKAIYWDGRNDLGEQVASGVYFYTLSAGDYSDTRKMVILK